MIMGSSRVYIELILVRISEEPFVVPEPGFATINMRSQLIDGISLAELAAKSGLFLVLVSFLL
jgi:hypothetical protein